MLRKISVGAAVSAALMLGSTSPQLSTVSGDPGGAVTGEIAGGPVGAAVGGVAGAVDGKAIDRPSQKVVTCVRDAPTPSTSVVVNAV
ncbi:hypothetical protein B5K06_25575 [Rhizobium grahamii]|uniref:Uncharacterized protein n=1 Tax=Rhizobium grahamii TaxID=1120045 RepID=A0A370KIV7_9HYPH|nr:hypothetical protein B5K06_25575 [Rhizobium grahamii]